VNTCALLQPTTDDDPLTPPTAGATGIHGVASPAARTLAPARTDRTRERWFALFAEWMRHRIGALVATAVDFAVMIALVEVLHLGAGKATAAGAFCGAITNFSIGRNWIFGRARGRATEQAIRYALVSAGGLLLNTGGESLLVGLGVGYVTARVIVATAISNLWHYPAHKFFVFPRKRSAVAG
jgi:putative flippase GtrA